MMFAIDLIIMGLAFFGADLLLANGAIDGPGNSILLLLPAILTASLLIRAFGLHQARLKGFSIQGVAEVWAVSLMLGATAYAAQFVPPFAATLSLSNAIVFTMVYFVMAICSRIIMREMVLNAYAKANSRKKVLIYGAGQTGQQLATALLMDEEFTAVAFIDDNTALRKMTISGLKVHAPSDIERLVKKDRIDRVVLAMPSVSEFNRLRILKSLKKVGCEVLAVPSFAEMVLKGSNIVPKLQPVDMSMILGRQKFDDDMPECAVAYRGRRILVTGAGGSIGSELCRQLLSCKPDCLVMLDHSELALYNISREVEELARGLHVVPVLGSVTDATLVVDLLTSNEIDVVFHAAAYKHVPLVEQNALQGLNNNVIGTRVVAEAARNAGVERFVLVSSDKAVRPTSTMGASKRLAEMVVQDLATRSTKTQFSMVRFGNVLGSSGSVIPLFQDQIRRGGPVTVTHDNVTRYFMTISEAVRLVLLAGTFTRGGDVFVLDMGKPVLIQNVARQMIEGSGFTVRDDENPDGDIEIKFIGLRPGEKLHEELLIGSDMLTTPHPKILRAQEGHPSEIEVANLLAELRKAVDSRNEGQASQIIAKWVETVDADQTKRDTVNT
ncbi:polysaccharide biosynthesis protein [Cognatishimia maritima]|uniref:NDP-sugar epimerase, includes UDP-GlcNAc-inverting 4,6-dehydratase FlaA1 and capsular polysaccharide biosynthesis protein EpsC n=1 Tax=Cognatishimia maritima TaxID=870908 RepID=A0A1M5P788_9RHOB|nr:nucleoside-diphosphate sugar epimerase/dehydratase [Cognatishimia maritima]SHG97309.1 NDP-sugar epimerase, includes UDP-GlcNAc-inverting 4,6-dehydratase FlaA1 and capsular polysaccharide biosynthesis protein EpsC [Cognatishimia maritima]